MDNLNSRISIDVTLLVERETERIDNVGVTEYEVAEAVASNNYKLFFYVSMGGRSGLKMVLK